MLPTRLRKVNNFAGKISGILFLSIACLITFEVIMRYALRMPVGWAVDYACYIALFALFGANAYTFMLKDHVNIDLVLGWVDKRTHSPHRKPRRTMQIINNFFILIFLGFLMYGAILNTGNAIKFNALTISANPIQTMWLHGFIVIACGAMIVTVIFIIRDLFTDSQEYL